MSDHSLRLFVYGTLRRPAGGPDSDTHYHSRIQSEIIDATSGTLDGAALVDCGAFPAICPGDGMVQGEVLTVTDEALAIADLIEGHPGFFTRRLETIRLDDGSTTEAWAYWAPASLLRTPSRRDIASGDWFLRERLTRYPTPVGLPEDQHLGRALDRLRSAPSNWLTTVRADGQPQPMPIRKVMAGNRIYLVVPKGSPMLTNIARRPQVVVTLPDPSDVVIVEGWAIEAVHLLDLVATQMIDTYGWDPRSEVNPDDAPMVVIEVTPRVIKACPEGAEPRTWQLD